MNRLAELRRRHAAAELGSGAERRIVVKDASGARGPSTDASLVGSEASAVRANEVGEILLTGLPMGNVKVMVHAQGFNLRLVTVTVRDSEETKVEVTLEVGTVGTAIEVPTATVTSLRRSPL